jgi:hypothetical protein
MRWPVIVSICVLASPAAAQTVNDFVNGNLLTITINSPVGSDRIDCDGGSNCRPISRAACDDATSQVREIRATINRGNVNLPASSKLFVWVQQDSGLADSCVFNGSSSSGTFRIGTLPISGTGLAAVGGTLNFPEQFDQNLTLTVGNFLNASGPLAKADNVVSNACTDSGIRKTYRLCFGINAAAADSGGGTSGVDNVQATDPAAWIRIVVLTQLPASVTSADVVGLDSQLRITPHASGERQDKEQWIVRIRPKDVSDSNQNCSDWADSNVTTTTRDAVGNSSIEVDATNGTLYEGCVYLQDRFGNASKERFFFTGKPVSQCDFVKCYPGELETGYCGALTPAPLAAAGLMLLWRRARKRRAVQNPAQDSGRYPEQDAAQDATQDAAQEEVGR